MTTMFTYQTPTKHALLGVQQEGLAVASIARDVYITSRAKNGPID